jgi:hypothetical protein
MSLHRGNVSSAAAIFSERTYVNIHCLTERTFNFSVNVIMICRCYSQNNTHPQYVTSLNMCSHARDRKEPRSLYVTELFRNTKPYCPYTGKKSNRRQIIVFRRPSTRSIYTGLIPRKNNCYEFCCNESVFWQGQCDRTKRGSESVRGCL